jgi:TonB-linked SusC/RagA family outer membrane protein
MFIRLIFTVKGNTWRSVLCLLCLLSCCSVAFAQARVSGKIVDADGIPVVGASVSEKGSTNGVGSDSDGKFSITVQSSASVLHISFVGYVTQDIPVGDRSEVNIVLLDDTQALDEIVVVGYGTQKKVNLSGSVSTISAKTLENRPVSNANLALQGLAPGMNIRMSDSYATSAPEINVRGFTSINGGSAFILVDNVPVTAQELSRMNPSDIETASVLKDAASAAIYGARAAFGVVLITTKTAKNEKLTVDFDANYGLRSFIDFPELVYDSYDYMQMQMLASDQPGRFSQEQLDYALQRRSDPSLPAVLLPEDAKNPSNRNAGNWEMYASSNWKEIFMKEYSPAQTYNLRVAQKGEKLAYVMSGGYYRQEGLMQNTVNDVLDRYNFRGVGTYTVSRWLELGSNVAFTRRSFVRSALLDDTWSYYRVVQGYPTIPLHTPDGYVENEWLGHLTSGSNKKTFLNESQLLFNTTVNLIKDVWTVKADATFRFGGEMTKTENFPFTVSKGPDKLSVLGDTNAAIDSKDEQYTVYNVYTDFHKTFAQKHFVLAMVGFNQEYYKNEESTVKANYLITPSLPTLQLTGPSSIVEKSHGIKTLALRGAFTRLSYIFDNKYIIEMNGRYDGTSRYQKSGRFGFFPSGSLAWNLSREAFMESLNKLLRINNLKLRGSYGTLGNQMMVDEDGNPVYYPYIATMGYNSRIAPMINGAQPASVKQPGVVAGDLTWETVRTINGGVDLNLLENRLELNFDRYVRYTEGMLTKSKTLPGIFGAAEPRANAANLKTQGWELGVSWRDEFALIGSPFSYSVRLTLSDNRTFITKYDNPTKILSHIENGKEVVDYYEGQEIGEVWGYETLGYFSSNAEVTGWADQSALGNGRPFREGDLKFKDLNNDNYINQGSNTVDDPGDQRIIGNKSYRFPYSGDLNIEWKGFDMRIFVEGIGRRTAYPTASHSGLWFWGQYTTYVGALTVKNLDSWDNKGDAGYFPRMKYQVAHDGELAKTQTKYMQDASYLRVKSLAVGYTLPRKLTGKVGVDRLRLYVTGENMFTFHHIEVQGIDPERFDDVYYPFMKVLSIGLNLSF